MLIMVNGIEKIGDEKMSKSKTTARAGYWECDCGRECRHKDGPERPSMCRAEWVQASPPPVQTNTWHPIETAPKDGTRFLGWSKRDGVSLWHYQQAGGPCLMEWGFDWDGEEGSPTLWMCLPDGPAL